MRFNVLATVQVPLKQIATEPASLDIGPERTSLDPQTNRRNRRRASHSGTDELDEDVDRLGQAELLVKRPRSVHETRPTGCVDTHKACAVQAAKGDCEEHPVWMGAICRKSCGWCSNRSNRSNRT